MIRADFFNTIGAKLPVRPSWSKWLLRRKEPRFGRVYAAHAQGIAQTAVTMTSLPPVTPSPRSAPVRRPSRRSQAQLCVRRLPIDGRTRTFTDGRFSDMGRTQRSRLRR